MLGPREEADKFWDFEDHGQESAKANETTPPPPTVNQTWYFADKVQKRSEQDYRQSSSIKEISRNGYLPIFTVSFLIKK